MSFVPFHNLLLSTLLFNRIFSVFFTFSFTYILFSSITYFYPYFSRFPFIFTLIHIQIHSFILDNSTFIPCLFTLNSLHHSQINHMYYLLFLFALLYSFYFILFFLHIIINIHFYCFLLFRTFPDF